MRDFQETINETFNEIEIRLTAKLLADGFQTHLQISTPEAFGSRYTEWRHDADKCAVRLVWDGKESWLLIEESPFSSTSDPNAWADVVIVPVDKTKVADVSYRTSLIVDIVDEIE